jgi:hypothetical protein
MCCNTMFSQNPSTYSQIRGSCVHHAMHGWTRCTRMVGSFCIKHKGSVVRTKKARHEPVKHVHKCCVQLSWQHGVTSPTKATVRRCIHRASTDACRLALLTHLSIMSRTRSVKPEVDQRVEEEAGGKKKKSGMGSWGMI